MSAVAAVLSQIDYVWRDGSDHDLDSSIIQEIEQSLTRGDAYGSFFMYDSTAGKVKRGWWFKLPVMREGRLLRDAES